MEVGALVRVRSRGTGFLACDNGDGSWNVELDDGSEGDFPCGAIVLLDDQSREALLQKSSPHPRAARSAEAVKPSDG